MPSRITTRHNVIPKLSIPKAILQTIRDDSSDSQISTSLLHLHIPYSNRINCLASTPPLNIVWFFVGVIVHQIDIMYIKLHFVKKCYTTCNSC